MEVFNLNLVPGKTMPVIHCSQFDKGRTFRANLFDGVTVFTLTGAETLSVIEKKEDGNMVTIAVTNTSDSYVEFATTEQMTALAGPQLCELRIEDGADLIGSLNFILDCEESPDTGIASDSAIHNLEAQVNQMVEDAVAEQYDSNNVLFDTAPTSGHGVPYAVTSGGLWSWVRDLPLRAYPTASGSIATFDTSLALPLQDCTIAINAVQEAGTPTPSSPKAITGFTGANIRVTGSNLWDEVVEEGYINSSGTPTSNVNSLRSKNFLPCTPNTAYYCYIPEDVIGGLAVCWYDANQTFISRDNQTHNVTSPANAFYFRLSLFNYKGTYPSYANNVGLNYPATDMAYHSYNANSTTTPITWNDEAGTVYGGALDVTSGVLTVEWFGVKPTDLTLNGYSTGSTSVCYRVNLVNNAILVSLISDKRGAKSNMSAENTAYFGVMRPNECDVNCFAITQDGTKIAIYDTDTTLTQAQFEAKYSDMFIIYPLATPLTYQLTPTQISAIVGTNNIFTDTNGDTSVMYACSLKDYVDSQ